VGRLSPRDHRIEAVRSCLAEALHLCEAGDGVWPAWSPCSVGYALRASSGGVLLAARGDAPPRFRRVDADDGQPFRLFEPEDGATDAEPLRKAVTVTVPDIVPTGRGLEEMVIGLVESAFQRSLELTTGAGPGGWRSRLVDARERYPTLSALNNALGNVEARALADALAERDEQAMFELATGIALVRRERRKEMDDDLIAYERERERFEGLASYAGARALARASSRGYRPSERFARLSGRRRYRDAGVLLESRLALLRALNRRGYGANDVRFGAVGMALALLLDRLHPGWRPALEDVAQHADALDRAVESRVRFDGGAGDDRCIASLQERYGYVELLEAERKYEDEESRRRRELLDEVRGAGGTRFTFDVSGLEPTGVECEHGARQQLGNYVHLYEGEVRFRFGKVELGFHGVPVLQDVRHGLFHVCVAGSPPRFLGDDSPVGIENGAEFVEGLVVSCPGVRVRAGAGYIKDVDGTIYVKITG